MPRNTNEVLTSNQLNLLQGDVRRFYGVRRTANEVLICALVCKNHPITKGTTKRTTEFNKSKPS